MNKVIACLFLCISFYSSFSIQAQYLQNGTFAITVPWNKSFKAMVTYKNGMPDGTWTIVQQGMVRLDTLQHTYVNGKLNGLANVKNTDGTIIEKTEYLNNELNGKREVFNYKNELISFYTYQNGRKQGEFSKPNETGSYDSGYLNGVYQKISSYSKAEIKGNYLKGKQIGNWEIKRGRYLYKVSFNEGKLHGPYEIYQFVNNDSMYINESGTLVNGMLDGQRTIFWDTEYPKIISHFKFGKSLGTTKYFYRNGSLREEWINDTVQQMWSRKGWFNDGKIQLESISQNGKTELKEYYKNGQLREEKVYGDSIFPQFYRYYDINGNLRSRDSFYLQQGKRHYASYSYRNDTLVAEKHVIDMKRVGKWFRKNKWDGEYVNEKFVGSCKDKWALERANNGQFYFKPNWLSEGQGQVNPLSAIKAEFPYGGSIWSFIDTSGRRFDDLTSLKSRNEVIKLVKKYDTLQMKGEVVFRCYVNSQGKICSPKLIKGINPYYDNAILGYLLWKTVSAENGIKPAWIELQYEF